MTITQFPGLFGGKRDPFTVMPDGTLRCMACANCMAEVADAEMQAHVRQGGMDVEIIGGPRPCLRAPKPLRDRSALGG